MENPSLSCEVDAYGNKILTVETPGLTCEVETFADKIFNEKSEVNEDGTLELPYLFYISDGQRKGSLIFHVKIEKKCYEYHLGHVRKNTCVMTCNYKDCKARSRLALRSEFISRKPGKRKTLFFINRDDPNLKNLSNWKVINYNNHHLHSERQGSRFKIRIQF